MGAVPAGVGFTSASTDSVSLAWSLDTPGTETPWVAFSYDPAFSVTLASAALTLGQQTTAYYGLSSNMSYYFKVKVSTDPDPAGYCATVSTVTPPGAPSSFAVTDLGISSVTAGWGQGNNAPGTEYWTELARDDSFALYSLSSGTAVSALYSGLVPNSTYFVRVRTVGVGGQDSGFVELSTITFSYPPGSEAYALVSSTTLSVIWDDNGNPAGTRYEITESTDAFATANYSTVTPGGWFEASSLRPNTTYYYRAAAYGWGGAYSGITTFGSTMTYAAPPAPNPPGLGVPDATSVQTQWSANGNPNFTEYYVQVSSSADFYGDDYGPKAWFNGPAYNVTGLESGRLYYFRVGARDTIGRPSGWLGLGSAATQAGADNTPPSVTDLQGGDDNWRGSASGAYMVHFSDLGSGLDRFQVKVTTGPSFSGTTVADWTDAVTGINSDSYAQDWVLPAPVFGAIQEAVTSYVSVRVYDKSANSTVYPDAFYVLRDTSPPTITNNAASPAGWLAADPGSVFDVDAADALSGLGQLLYSASASAGAADGGVLGWTAVPGFSTGPVYTALWGVDFTSLKDGVTNYISVRAIDKAGNPVTLADAFRILKNTVGPAMSIITPSTAYVSTVSAVSGAAAGMTESSPPTGSQVSLQELTGNLYFDGASFSSVSQVWLEAQGLTSWSYNASTVPFSAGTQYKLSARARDGSGRITALPYPSVTFSLDQVPPTVWLSTPLAGTTVYALDAVGGTAADAGGAGLAEVDIYMRRVSDGKWWNFVSADWDTVQVASAVPAGASWTFTPGTALRGALANAQQYFVAAVARDAAGPPNASSFGMAGSTFTWLDTVPPEAVADFAPSTGTSPGRIRVSWTFPGDDGGLLALTYGQFAIQYSTDPAVVFATRSAQVLISTAMVRPGSAQAYTLSGLTPETTYYLRMWVKDDADLWSSASPLSGTLSGDRLNDMIAGTIKTPAGAGVTGVIVDAVSSDGIIVATAYSLDDGLGSFTLSPLPDGLYRVQATWTEHGFASSIAKDLVPMGYADANFELSIDYALASVSGVLPAAVPAAIGPSSVSGGEAQLWRGTRLLARTYADAAGRFTIRNLIPGAYTLRARAGGGAWKSLDIQLAPGQDLQVKPLGVILARGAVYAYPNPASSKVTFHVESGVYPVRVRISVFSLDGSLVRTAEGAISGSAPYEYTWNFSGNAPASGIYFYTVRIEDDLGGETAVSSRKFAVIR
ncbi:MAG: hypothetical protein M0011_09440 [Elusimicrobia bacterium]|nr:hypothetical protein [Elusimicrobiota bacterium]